MKTYFDDDADLSLVQERNVAILGYGNQGRAQALNLRDSGVKVLVGNVEDPYAKQARSDGFTVYPMAEAVPQADVIVVLLPDELHEGLYETEIAPHLKSGQTLQFASGYSIHYRLVRPPQDVDVVMVAPRMIGVNVRGAFQHGGGVPAYVDVWQDASGVAFPAALSFAKAIGATRAGVIQISFREETELDLFPEQTLVPAFMNAMVIAFEVLVDNGYSPEAVVMELYGTGEAAEIFLEMAHTGLFKQMTFHSHTAQYGTLTNMDRVIPAGLRENYEKTLAHIRSGEFMKEFRQEQAEGLPTYQALREKVLAHPINRAEEDVGDLVESVMKAGQTGG